MKRDSRLLALTMMTALCLLMNGCSPLVKNEDIQKNYTIYASFYPIYALSSLVIHDIPKMTLRQLIQPQDGCLRSYTLSDWDAYLLMNADALIIGGQGLESFGNSLGALNEDGPVIMNAMTGLSLLRNGDASDSHFSGINPWLFMSVDGATEIVRAICSNMLVLDEPYSQNYIENANAAIARLNELKQNTLSIVGKCDMNVPIALAHEGLRYYADEFELNVVTVIDRESGVYADETALADMFDTLTESGAKAVLIEKQAPDTLVSAFINNGFTVVKIDTMSTGVEAMGADGYFEVMIENAEALADGLRNISS